MSTDFTSRKLAWLEAVACDRALPRSAVALAVLLACRYFNGETGEAWPAESTLARDLNITQANVHMAVERLIAAKFLRRQSGGPRTTNKYSIPKRWRAPERYCQQDSSDITSNIAGDIAHNSAATLPAILEPGNEPVRRTREGTPRPQRRRLSRDDTSVKGSTTAPRRTKRSHAGRRGRTTLLPRNWLCGDAELAAARKIANWGNERARSEFEKFCTWHGDRGNRSADWAASWRTWCSKGHEFDERDRERTTARPRDRAARAAAGAAGWYERQKAARSQVGREEE